MKRNFGLDLVRAISIWMVLFQHAGLNIPGLKALKIGGIGVEIFFVISGFLIGGIIFKEIDKKQNLLPTLRHFWVRRWFRILPLYYLVLLFKFLIIDDSIGWNILYYFFFLQNNFYGISFLDVSWSLVIEEWFYLFSPIYLYIISKLSKTNIQVVSSIILFILLIIGLRTVYVINNNIPYAGVNSNFIFRFDSLFIGVLLSYLKYKKMSTFEFLKKGFIFILGSILFLGYIYYFWTISTPVYLVDSLLFPRTLGFFFLPFTIGLMIPYITNIQFDSTKNKLNYTFFQFITWTSILTYAIYLTHPFIYGAILKNHSFTNTFIALFFTYLISWLVYTYFEKPILKYRDKVMPNKKTNTNFSNQ